MLHTKEVTIFWFRRDLRLHDNTALYHALKENLDVLPVFIFDTVILDQLEDKSDRRVTFIHRTLSAIQEELIAFGSGLLIFHGVPSKIFKELFLKYQIKKVYANHDYEPYARERDENIRAILKIAGVEFKTFKDQCIFEKKEVIKENGDPYTVFTPYSRKWKSLLNPSHYKVLNSKHYLKNFHAFMPRSLPSLQELGFIESSLPGQKLTVDKLLLKNYEANRNFPAGDGTSRMSVQLRFGIVSIRQLVALAVQESEPWLNELIWRDFYMMILWHFPHAEKRAFKKAYDNMPWRNNESEFIKWCKGETGYPIVDAGMRELNATGFMHNRVRMIVSSFLVKDLLVDWRWGEAYFAQKLNDFDLSANNGGWQWAAGSGCDAAPYFRIFNPVEQQKKFDPHFIYIKKWIPEFGTPAYSPVMVDHAAARLRALAAYKKALREHA